MLSIDQEYRSVQGVQEAIRSGESTAKLVTYDYVRAIRKLNSEINAYTAINERALDDAEILDATEPAQRGPLYGVPIAVKDNIETAGIRTAFGSKACKDNVPKRDATLIRKLKESGAIILGKTSIPDWSLGFLSASTLTDGTNNPHDGSRDTGGSSSGSAAAVSSGMALAAIGTDTKGSIRVPAAFNGLVGICPTPGRISKDGISPLIPFRDSPGPLAKTVTDCAHILDVLTTYDPLDPATSLNYTSPVPSTFLSAATSNPTLKSTRLGVLRPLFGTHPGILSLLDETLTKLTSAGATLVEISIPDIEIFRTHSLAHQAIKPAIEAFLASRKDLAHIKKFNDLPNNEMNGLMNMVRNSGEDASMSPHYARMFEVVREWQGKIGAVFAEKGLHGVVLPTVRDLPPRREDVLASRVTTLNLPINTDISSALQWPAMSIPIGKTRDPGDGPDGPELPVGLDLLGMPMRDVEMVAIGAGIEVAVKGQ